MAVTAYASLVSLTHVLDNVQHLARLHRLHPDTDDQIRTLQEKVEFLQGFLEIYSQRISQEIKDLAKQLAGVADETEDIIDFHVVNQLCEKSQDESRRKAVVSSFCQDIDKIIRKIDSITEELMLVKEERVDVKEQQPVVSVPVVSTTLLPNNKSTMVGFDECLLEVMDELTRGGSNLQILPIVGMGGIGKTTLAQNVFDHPYIVNHFDIRVWFTISHQYSVREILLKYLSKDKKEEGTTDKSGVAELGERFYKCLFGKRYLIVMDDIWSIKTWEDFMLYFPNFGNGSRILVTTRLLDVARHLGFDNHYISVKFLDEDKSWDLLCERVFAQKSCPYLELEEIGRKIAKGCCGLPLAIIVISGLLAKSSRTREYWEFVAENVTSFVNSGDDDYCLKILSLSYNSLPIHLKPCFLYMGIFPEDHEIRITKLTKLWISEGFLKPIGGKNLEEVAEEYLTDLIDRNLILIRKWTRSGKIKTCSVHDVLRELCVRELSDIDLIRVPKAQYIGFKAPLKDDDDCCFLCRHKLDRPNKIQLHEVLDGLGSTTTANPSVCEACNNRCSNLNRLRWVKILKLACDQSGGKFPQHTKLQYLDIKEYSGSCDYYYLPGWKALFPSTISLLWNLQILIIHVYYKDSDYGDFGPSSLVLPSEIWEMPKLRHLMLQGHRLPDPPICNGQKGQDATILENLSIVSSAGFRCTDEVVKRIPNLKKLYTGYSLYPVDDAHLNNLVKLNKLESFFLACCSWLEIIAFPTSLKKLTLSYCRIHWEDMTIIGLLPNLEVFKLIRASRGPEWSPCEGGFLRLKTLSIRDCFLVRWAAEDTHFPNLQSLILTRMHYLEEIPLSIGDINTLQSIHLESCSASATNSAMKILEDQKEKGNESLQVYVDEKRVGVS